MDGNMFSIIHAMYKNAKSCVWQSAKLSEYFQSNVGVRQDEKFVPCAFFTFSE
jgi:hypothetical protein